MIESFVKTETVNVTYNLSFDRASIDSEISKVSEEFLGTVLALHELEEVWGIVNELFICHENW
jgi:hypothetical protein